jgi:hypothetical protein
MWFNSVLERKKFAEILQPWVPIRWRLHISVLYIVLKEVFIFMCGEICITHHASLYYECNDDSVNCSLTLV